MFERIRVTESDGVATLTLANPAKRNTLSKVTMLEITAALAVIAEGDALAVVIDAEGPAWSAGHDFTDMVDATYEDGVDLLDTCTNMMMLVQQIPQVVVAKVHALATAAGCQLVASCDLAVASESAGFAAPGGKGGLFCHTPAVAISRAVGLKRGMEMAVTGDIISAQTALDWGLINRVVPDDELDAATADLVARATRGSAMSKAMGKECYYAQFDMDIDDAYRHAVHVMATGVTLNDGQEGIKSFIEKRRPVWTNS